MCWPAALALPAVDVEHAAAPAAIATAAIEANTMRVRPTLRSLGLSKRMHLPCGVAALRASLLVQPNFTLVRTRVAQSAGIDAALHQTFRGLHPIAYIPC